MPIEIITFTIFKTENIAIVKVKMFIYRIPRKIESEIETLQNISKQK